MGQTKIEFKWFTIPQYKQEEEYLGAMHRKGWKFTNVTFPGFYHFEQCEPETVTYRLDYNQEGISNKSEYVQMFADCGWDYLLDFVGYSYFRKASDDESIDEDIFCDDESRFDMMKRVFKGRIVPLIIIFFGVILPQLYTNMNGYGGGWNIVQKVLSYTLLAMGIVYVILFGTFTWQFYQYEKGINPDRDIKWKYIGIEAGLIAIFGTMIGIVFMANRSSYEHVDEESGELNISISREGERPVFYGNTFDEFGKFEVEINEAGLYQINCSGKRAGGKIEIEIQ